MDDIKDFFWELETPPTEIVEYLDNRISAIQSKDKRDKFRETSQELIENWSDYGNDFYHGTQNRKLEMILEEGQLEPSVSVKESLDFQSFERTEYDESVALTSLVPVALHYSKAGYPLTLTDVSEVITDLVPDTEEINLKNVDSAKDLAKNAERIQEHLPKELKGSLDEFSESTNNFQDLPKEENINKPTIILGQDRQEIDHNLESLTHDEFEALKYDDRRRIGETRVSNVTLEGCKMYIPWDYDVESEGDFRILDKDSLLLKHEIYMLVDDTYPKEGKLRYGSYWEGNEELEILRERWNSKPHIIDISE